MTDSIRHSSHSDEFPQADRTEVERPRPDLPDMMSLEPRILLDAAAVATGAEIVAEAIVADAVFEAMENRDADAHSEAVSVQPLSGSDVAALSPPNTGESGGKDLGDVALEPVEGVSVYVVDANVANDVLGEALPEDAVLITVGAGESGVRALRDAVEANAHVGTVHVVPGHGADGLTLGRDALTADALAGDFAEDLRTIGARLGESGLITIDAPGQTDSATLFALAGLTGADVTASADAGPSVDLNGAAAGHDHALRFEPTTTTVVPITSGEVAIASASGNVDSVTVGVGGVVDAGGELLFHIGPDGNTAFFLVAGTQAATVSIGDGVQLEVVRDGTTLTITGVGGAATSAVNIETFLEQLYYGDISAMPTEGDRTVAVSVTDGGQAGAASVSTMGVYFMPVADNDAGTVQADSTVPATGNVLLSDTDASGNGPLVVSGVNGTSGAEDTVVTTTYGTITIAADGAYSYSVDTANPTVLGLQAGASVADVIAYEVTDPDGNTDTAFITITILGVDELPVATDNSGSVVAQDQPETSGNVIFDDDGAGQDSGDRPLSQLVWEAEFANGESVDGQRVTVDGVDVEFTTIDPNGIAGASNHVVSYGQNGGHDGYLVFTGGGTADPGNAPHTLDIRFSTPVTNLSFTLADIDWSQGTAWQDQFSVVGYLDGEEVDLSAQVAGTVANPEPGVFYGTGSVPATEAHGNVTVLFGTPVDSVQIRYNYGPDATARDGFQVGALSDLQWQSTAVPRVFAVGGDDGSVGKEVEGTYGTFTIHEDGSYTYLVDDTHPDVAALAPGATLTDAVVYTLIDTEDDSGNRDDATLSITITGPEDADGDGVSDARDLDDDNDGISDLLEGSATETLLTGDVILHSDTHPEDDAALFDDDPSADGHLHPGDATEFRLSTDVRAGDQLVFQGGSGAFDIYVRQSAADPWVLLGSNVDVPSVIPVTMDFREVRIEANYGAHVEFSGALVRYDTPLTRDTDGDGIADHLDLDSDNDGISDLEESGSGALDADRDGVLDGMADPAGNDTDGDGLLDSLSGSDQVVPRQTDADGLADYLDLDSDGDGIADAVEARPTGAPDITSTTDTDGDGVIDLFDANAGFGGSFAAPYADSDDTADATPDYLDLDSDGDGFSDAVEAGVVGDFTYADPDGTVRPVSTGGGEADFRTANLRPTLSLDPDNSGGGADSGGFVAAFVETSDSSTDPYGTQLVGSGGVALVDADAVVGDGGDNDLVALHIDVESAPDGGAEVLTVMGDSGSVDVALGADLDALITVGGVDVVLTYRVASGRLSLQSADGVTALDAAALRDVLRSITYRNDSDTPDEADRTFAIRVEDRGRLQSEGAVSTVSVAPTPDRPEIDVQGAAIFTEGDAPVALAGPGASVFDAEGDISSLTVTVAGLRDGAAETLRIVDADGQAVSVDLSGASTHSVRFGGTLFTLSYAGATLEVTAGGTDIPADDLAALIAALGYSHGSDAPTAGERAFTFVAADAAGTVSTAAVLTVAVVPVNDAPVASTDGASTAEDVAVIVDVLDGDTDPDGDTLFVSAVTQGANGTVAIVDGRVVYTPDANFHGLDTFTYTVSDGEGGESTATVTVNVTPVNDAPITVATLPAQSGSDGAASSPLDTSVAFRDVDGDTLVFSASGLPDGLTIDPATGVISGTPASDSSQGGPEGDGVYTIVVTATDPSGETASTTFVWSLGNPAPVVDTPIGAQSAEDGDAVVFVPDFSDPDGDTLLYSASGLPDGLTIDPTTGEITGTLAADASQGGPYVITVTASDGQGGTATDTFVLSVGNPAPDATDNVATTSEDTAVTIDVLGDDSDPDGDALVVDAVTQGANGTVAVVDGRVVYTPDADFHGRDTFTYTISDGEGGESTATVTVTVSPVNDAPVVVQAIPAQSGADGAPVSPLDASLAFADVDHDTLVFSANGLPEGLSLDPATGVITGTPAADSSQGGPDGNGVYAVTVTATDPSGESVATTFVWTVGNPGPVVDTPIGAQAAQDGDAVSFASAISDPDGDTLVYSASGLPGGLTIDPATGEITGTLAADASQGGPYVITVTADDGQGGLVTDTFVLTVGNPAPVADADRAVTDEDTAIEVEVRSNDLDPDGDALTVVAVTQGVNGTVVIDPATGNPVYTPNSDFHGTDTFTYTVSDGEGGESTATVTVVVMPVNDAPEAVSALPDQAGGDSAPASPLDASLAFADVDDDTLVFSASGLPEGLSIDPATGVISGTPTADASQGGPGGDGVYAVTVTATDPDGLSAEVVFGWTVSNPAPEVVTPVGPQVARDGDAVVFTPDFRDPDGDVLRYSASGLAGGLSIDPATGVITGTLAADASQGGPYTVTVTADDGQGGVTTDTFVLSVSNPAPVVDTPIGLQEADDGDTVRFTPAISDPDGDTLVYSASGLPDGLVIDPATGEITGTLAAGASQSGPYTVVVTASDGEGGVVTDTFVLVVSNPAPVVVAPTLPQTASDGDAMSIATAFADPDGDALAYSASGLPEGLSIDPATGLITGTLPADSSQGGVNGSGIYVITVTASDGEGGVVTDTFVLTVGNPAPDAVDDRVEMFEDGTAEVRVLGNDTDPDGDTLSVVEVTQGGNGTVVIDPITGNPVYTPDADFHGTDTFTYTISDGEGGTSVATVTVVVRPVNDAPTAVAELSVQRGEDSAPLAPLDVTAAFGDVDGDTLRYTSPDLPEWMELDPETGVLSGTPPADASVTGLFIVTVVATDPSGESASVRVQITVSNPAPEFLLATADQWWEDGQSVRLSTFAVDPDGDTLRYSATGLPPGLSVDADTGEIVGRVDRSASQGGPYTVLVTASDGQGGEARQLFTVHVANPGPVASDDSFTVNAGESRTVDVVAGSDFDPDGDDLRVAAVGGDASAVGVAVAGSNGGTFTIAPDGTVTFSAGTDFAGLDVGETATTTLEYTLSDGEGGVDTATVTVTVVGRNDAPVSSGSLAGQTGTDGQPLAPFDASTVLSDVDGEALLYSLHGAPTWMVIDPVTGVISGTPPGDGSQGGVDGVYSFTVTATDPDGESVSEQVVYTLRNTPVMAADDALVLPEDTRSEGNLLGNDADRDGDALAVSHLALPDGTPLPVGQAVELPQGVLTVEADGSYTFVAAPDFHGTLVVGYVVTDGQGSSDGAALLITVTPEPDAPAVVGGNVTDGAVTGGDLGLPPELPPVVSPEGQPLAPIPVADVFGDADGEALVYTLEGAPSWLVIDPSTGVITGTAPSDAGRGGLVSFAVVATDPTGLSARVTQVLDLRNVAPEAAADGVTTPEDTAVTVDVLRNDVDGDGDALAVVAVDGQPLVAGTPVSVIGGTVVLNGDGTLTFAPAADSHGTLSFRYTLSDGQGGESDAAVTVTVEPRNDAPVVAGGAGTGEESSGEGRLADRDSVAGEAIAPVDMSTPFQDPDGDALVFSATGLPPGLSLDPLTGVVSGTLATDASAGGPYTVAVTATDPNGQSVTALFVWEVAANPEPDLRDGVFADVEAGSLHGHLALPLGGPGLVDVVSARGGSTLVDNGGFSGGLGGGFASADVSAGPDMAAEDVDLGAWFSELRSRADDVDAVVGGARDAGYRGGTLLSPIAGCGVVSVDAVARPHGIAVGFAFQGEGESGCEVRSWTVDGETVKSGALLLPRGGLRDALRLDVRAVLSDGRTVRLPVSVDVHTGQLERAGQAGAHRSTLSEQVAARDAERLRPDPLLSVM